MKRKKGQSSEMILGFVIVVIFVIISVAVTNELVNDVTEIQSITREALTTSNATAVQLDNDNLVTNVSCDLIPYTTNLEAGTILWSDTHPSNATLCNYTHYPDGYTTGSASTIMKTIVVFFAILGITIIGAFAVSGKL